MEYCGLDDTPSAFYMFCEYWNAIDRSLSAHIDSFVLIIVLPQMMLGLVTGLQSVNAGKH